MNNERPNPDEILRKIIKEEDQDHRGKLKIFFGYAAGVGKTYAMLDAAQIAQKAGIDVIVGYVEPHTRPETLALLEGLESLPPLKATYKGITLNEFNLEAAIERHPQLILVDELAHSNSPACRHTKRYNDINELLDAGIDVYTTVNVQHLESLNDIVASITQVTVKERIPDSVFDGANKVELVDIEPDDLIARLNDGKIYRVPQAKRALDNFFTRENLIALREIALRRTADCVNRALESNKSPSKSSQYYTGEHIMICLSGSPSNTKVIRTAARMANAFHAAFTALYVETPHTKELNSDDSSRLQENIKLAEQLGAKIATVYGNDMAYQIAAYAEASAISKIVVGRSNNKHGILRPKNNFVERLTTLAPNLDVYIIPDNLPPYSGKKKFNTLIPTFSWKDIIKTVSILTLCTLIGFVFYHLNFSDVNIINIYILGVLLVSNQTNGRFYGIASSILGVLVFNFFFTDPRFTLNAYGAEYPVTFLVMLVASLITSTLTMRVKNQARSAAMKAHRTEALLETSQKLQRAETIDDIINESSSQLLKLMDTPISIYLANDGKLSEPHMFYPPEENGKTPVSQSNDYICADEQAVAAWVYRNKKQAGISTETLPGSRAFYLPVSSQHSVLAVVGIMLSHSGDQMDPFDRSMLLSMLNEIAFAIEKYQLNEMQKEISMQAEKERLRANLLRAISHDLRTPLTSISGSASILLTDGDNLAGSQRHKLYEDIYDDAMWLINLVENLLSVTRIDNGTMSIRQEPELVEEIVTEALQHLNRMENQHTITVDIKDSLLMVRADARLIIQVIINIVDNAIKYTQPTSHICLSAVAKGKNVVIEIADDGEGITPQDKMQLFDMFYTANNSKGDSRRGLGLGLPLCKSIIDAHGGEVYIKDNHPKGTIFGFTLVLEEVTEYEQN